MTPNAQIEIVISVDHAGAKRVTITNNRPVQAAQVFVGKRVSEALRLIPLLFNVCGKAQGLAAVTAMEQALALPIVSETKTQARLGREVIRDCELLREHMLRILLDWASFMPDEFNSSDMNAELQALMTLQPQFEQALFNGAKPFELEASCHINHSQLNKATNSLESFLIKHIYGAPPALWLAADSRDVVLHWMQNAKTLAGKSCNRLLEAGIAKIGARELDAAGSDEIPFLPPLNADIFADKLFGDEAETFIHQPTYGNYPHETTALSRHHTHPLLRAMIHSCGRGLLTRQIARLVEIAAVFESLSQRVDRLIAGDFTTVETTKTTTNLPDHRGIALVEASRGLLVHAVELETNSEDKFILEDPVISGYRILAPTEWNFHPQGVLAFALESIPRHEPDEIKLLAEMLISSIDPCTGTKLEVRHA